MGRYAHLRYCEERSDLAIHASTHSWIATACGLAMTGSWLNTACGLALTAWCGHYRASLADTADFMGLHTELPHGLLQAQVYANFGIALLEYIV